MSAWGSIGACLFYTVGQREGLGIAAPRPLYVLDLDAVHNALVVAMPMTWGGERYFAEEMTYISGEALPDGALARLDSLSGASRAAAHVWAASGGCARIVFDQPLRDIAPGQAVGAVSGRWRCLGRHHLSLVGRFRNS